MKATLTFNLPEEQYEHKAAVNATAVLYALGEFSEFMRSRLKYQTLTEEQAAELASVRERFIELCNEYLQD